MDIGDVWISLYQYITVRHVSRTSSWGEGGGAFFFNSPNPPQYIFIVEVPVYSYIKPRLSYFYIKKIYTQLLYS